MSYPSSVEIAMWEAGERAKRADALLPPKPFNIDSLRDEINSQIVETYLENSINSVFSAPLARITDPHMGEWVEMPPREKDEGWIVIGRRV